MPESRFREGRAKYQFIADADSLFRSSTPSTSAIRYCCFFPGSVCTCKCWLGSTASARYLGAPCSQSDGNSPTYEQPSSVSNGLRASQAVTSAVLRAAKLSNTACICLALASDLQYGQGSQETPKRPSIGPFPSIVFQHLLRPLLPRQQTVLDFLWT